MALIKCPECSREISDKAKSCPHCGFPIDALSLEVREFEEKLIYPSFSDDLSIGELTHQVINTIYGYYENNGSKEDYIQSGKMRIRIHENGLSIRPDGFYRSLFDINYQQIIYIEEYKADEIARNKSVLGRAILGYVTLGPLAAILGGMSGIQSSTVERYLLIITYWDTRTKKPAVFSLLTEYSCQWIIDGILDLRSKLLDRLGKVDNMPATPAERQKIFSIRTNSPQKINASDEDVLREIREAKKQSSKLCFVATVVYEDSDCFEVKKLREWRDTKLKKNILGRIFIWVYYRVGERLSLMIKPHSTLKIFIREKLDWLVKHI